VNFFVGCLVTAGIVKIWIWPDEVNFFGLPSPSSLTNPQESRKKILRQIFLFILGYLHNARRFCALYVAVVARFSSKTALCLYFSGYFAMIESSNALFTGCSSSTVVKLFLQ
jgi:hypothetical protein